MRDAFFKGHGLGNDYLVVDPEELSVPVTPRFVRALCDRHTGVGADGLLVGVPPRDAHFGVRIFNPDGSEAERSGNGLRIFARWLVDHRGAPADFSVHTLGGVVHCAVLNKGSV